MHTMRATSKADPQPAGGDVHVVDVGWGWILKAPRGSTMDFLAMMAFVRSEQADATPLNDTALDSSLCCIPVPVPALLILTLWWRSIASAISRRRPWGGTGLRGHPDGEGAHDWTRPRTMYRRCQGLFLDAVGDVEMPSHSPPTCDGEGCRRLEDIDEMQFDEA